MALRRHGIGMVVGLVIQYILGMTSNLFVKFPESGSEAQMWEFAKSHLPTLLHIIVATLLVIGAFILLGQAVKQKNSTWIKASTLGLIFILLAGFAGSQFVPTQNDSYSYLMSLAFIAALLSYFWGIYSSK